MRTSWGRADEFPRNDSSGPHRGSRYACGQKECGDYRAPMAAPYRITVVCLGNICRSPIGEVVLRTRLVDAGLADRYQVDSAGTGDWHLGHGADPRSIDVLNAHGYEHDHTARQITSSWMADTDLLLAMDESNYRNLQELIAHSGCTPDLRMMRSFDPALSHLPEPHPGLDVPDPYHGGPEGFVHVLQMIELAADGVVDWLSQRPT